MCQCARAVHIRECRVMHESLDRNYAMHVKFRFHVSSVRVQDLTVPLRPGSLQNADNRRTGHVD